MTQVRMANGPRGFRCALFTPDDNVLITRGYDGVIRSWNAMPLNPICVGQAYKSR